MLPEQIVVGDSRPVLYNFLIRRKLVVHIVKKLCNIWKGCVKIKWQGSDSQLKTKKTDVRKGSKKRFPGSESNLCVTTKKAPKMRPPWMWTSGCLGAASLPKEMPDKIRSQQETIFYNRYTYPLH